MKNRNVSVKELKQIAKENRLAKRTQIIDSKEYQTPFYNSVEDEMYSLYEYARKFKNFRDDDNFEEAYIESRNQSFTINEIFYAK